MYYLKNTLLVLVIVLVLPCSFAFLAQKSRPCFGRISPQSQLKQHLPKYHQPSHPPAQPLGRSTGSLQTRHMGIFDAFNKAFANEKYSSPPEGVKATARHILVKTEDDVSVVMNELKGGMDFATVARQYSTCPSSSQGGSLGSFSPGTMVAEFDRVIFSPETEIGQIVGPVQTQFGYHLIVVDKRTGV